MRTDKLLQGDLARKNPALFCFYSLRENLQLLISHGVDNVGLYTEICAVILYWGGECSQYCGLIFLSFNYLFIKHCTSKTFAFSTLTGIFMDISHCVGPMSYKILHSKCDGFLHC